MRRWRIVIGAVVVALAGCSAVTPAAPGLSGPAPTEYLLAPAPAQTGSSRVPSSATSLTPAVTVASPTVVVTPSRGLADGETVVVRVTGFGASGKVFLSECASVAAVTWLGCGAQLAAQTFLLTDDAGAGSSSFIVHGRAATKALGGSPLATCTTQCVVVATIGGIAEDNGRTYYGFASAPISFGNR